jgi:hypothetical protein
MKQHITVENLMELTEYQRDRLNDLWTPQKYDLAAGFLCKDAENNEYDIFEFVIGNVNIGGQRSGYHITLTNLEAQRGLEAQTDEPVDEEADMEEYNEEDFVFEYERPDIYSKADCMPLLSTGQMLEILNKCGYGNGSFYVNYQKETDGYGVGRNIEEYIDFGPDYNGEELCDALWAAVKETL